MLQFKKLGDGKAGDVYYECLTEPAKSKGGELQKEQGMTEDNVSKRMGKREMTMILCPYNRTY